MTGNLCDAIVTCSAIYAVYAVFSGVCYFEEHERLYSTKEAAYAAAFFVGIFCVPLALFWCLRNAGRALVWTPRALWRASRVLLVGSRDLWRAKFPTIPKATALKNGVRSDTATKKKEAT